jgi:hypothetical protein
MQVRGFVTDEEAGVLIRMAKVGLSKDRPARPARPVPWAACSGEQTGGILLAPDKQCDDAGLRPCAGWVYLESALETKRVGNASEMLRMRAETRAEETRQKRALVAEGGAVWTGGGLGAAGRNHPPPHCARAPGAALRSRACAAVSASEPARASKPARQAGGGSGPRLTGYSRPRQGVGAPRRP